MRQQKLAPVASASQYEQTYLSSVFERSRPDWKACKRICRTCWRRASRSKDRPTVSHTVSEQHKHWSSNFLCSHVTWTHLVVTYREALCRERRTIKPANGISSDVAKPLRQRSGTQKNSNNTTLILWGTLLDWQGFYVAVCKRRCG